MVTATHVRRPVHHQIVPIVHPVHTVIAIPGLRHVLVRIVQRVAHTEIAIPVQVRGHLRIVGSAVTVHVIRVQVLIVQPVVHMAIAIHVRHHAQARIVHVVARRVDRQIDAMTVILDRAIHDPRQINPAEATHTVAIAHALAMIAMLVHHAMIVAVRAIANAEADQIVPAVVSPMIAKNVHAVALAKSA
jgi:hypothetical protein